MPCLIVFADKCHFFAFVEVAVDFFPGVAMGAMTKEQFGKAAKVALIFMGPFNNSGAVWLMVHVVWGGFLLQRSQCLRAF